MDVEPFDVQVEVVVCADPDDATQVDIGGIHRVHDLAVHAEVDLVAIRLAVDLQPVGRLAARVGLRVVDPEGVVFQALLTGSWAPRLLAADTGRREKSVRQDTSDEVFAHVLGGPNPW